MVGSKLSLILIVILVVTFPSRATPIIEEPSSDEIISAAPPLWPPSTNPHVTVQDLHREYNTIFRYGNRNAASHLWSTFLLNRAPQMTRNRLKLFFSGFCAVSGSPIRPNNYNRYKLTLPRLGGGHVTGTMHYCCWPCVCDTQDFIRIDTLTITVSTAKEGDAGSQAATTTTETKQLFFAVIGNPCDHPDRLEEPFYQPFYGGRTTTLSETAQEVRCTDDGRLEGATLSDHGYVILSMFFDAKPEDETHETIPSTGVETDVSPPQPGRITTMTSPNDDQNTQIMVQDEWEYGPRCQDRADHGYNSGMGEIFRMVCAISPIPNEALAAPLLLEADEIPLCDAAVDLDVVASPELGKAATTA